MEAKLKPNRTAAYIADELDAIQEQIAKLKNEERIIKNELLDHFELQIGMAYMQKDEPFGVVHLEEDGLKFSFTTPKKVEWNQEILAKLYKEAGVEYVNVDYSVSEAKYKTWNKAIRDEFLPARTVEPGTITIKFERIEK